MNSSSDDPTLPPTRSLRPGERVANRYVIQALIGFGAFGRVFRAHDDVLDKTIAMKCLNADRLPASSFVDEARTIARLDHPNIIAVFDAGMEDEIPWLTMRLVEGESLEVILKKEGKLNPVRAVALLTQAARALDHAHRRGIVHRDVKPSNMIIERAESSDHLWLADFGIAKVLSGDTSNTRMSVAGTPSYMSPEQITGKTVDARADIFSFGCVAYELILGKKVFTGDSFSQIAYKLVHEQPESLAELGGLAGKAFESMVRRALAKSPEDRFQTMEEVIRELEGIAQSPHSPGKPSTPRLFQNLFRRKTEHHWDGRQALVIDDLHKGYGFRKKVLTGVHIGVQTGAVYGLLGRNGSGKTTLIRTLIGLYRQESGRVAIFGRDPSFEYPAILGRIGYVPETVSVYEWMNVGQLIQFLQNFYPRWDKAYCYSLLSRFELPIDVKIKDMSKGMKTKVSLIAALSHRPELLVLDDPTLGLDRVILQEFFDTIAEASRQEGTTIFLSSHNIDKVEKVATHIGLLTDGKMLVSDTIAGLKMRTREVRLTFRDDVPPIGNIAQFKTVRTSGRHLTGFILDASSGALEHLKALGPEDIQVRELSLEEIFVNFVK